MSGCCRALLALALVVAAPVSAAAQATDTPTPPAAGSQPAQPLGQPAAQPQADQQLMKPEQLEALVAPIALHPDELLANILAAATYPLEAVQADRWVKANNKLKGDALKAAVDKQVWDDSVKALVSTPDVLAMMSDKIDWTKNLGDAMLAQQADLMDAIQRLRAKAQARNKLVTNKQQKVSVQRQDNKEVIVIEQAQPDKVYVPYYQPEAVYGEWPYAAYPPYYFGYPSYIGAGVIATGLAFGAGWAIGRWGNYWGGGCNWGNRNVYVNHHSRINNVGNNWQHNPAHRQGVKYNNANVANRFGNNNLKAGAGNRADFRGRDGQQVLRAGQDRPGSGDRAGDRVGDRGSDQGGRRDRAVGDRAGTGDRANRPSTADRSKGGGDRAKGGGDRAKAGNRGGGARAANRGGRDSALSGVASGKVANLQSARGRESVGGRDFGGGRGGGAGASFAGRRGGGGGFQAAGGGGGFRGGGGGFRGGGGGGRRSDIALKHDIVLLGYLDNGLGYYRFSYLGEGKTYVGVMAQEVQALIPRAVTRGSDGYLRVHYEELGLTFRTYRDWIVSGAQIPSRSRM